MTNPWTVYLSGPISGNPNYKADFLRAERVLRTAAPTTGVFIINPAARRPPGLTNREYMQLSFAEIDIAQDVCLIPGWENSDGCKLEVAYANYTGKPVFILEDRFPELIALKR